MLRRRILRRHTSRSSSRRSSYRNKYRTSLLTNINRAIRTRRMNNNTINTKNSSMQTFRNKRQTNSQGSSIRRRSNLSTQRSSILRLLPLINTISFNHLMRHQVSQRRNTSRRSRILTRVAPSKNTRREPIIGTLIFRPM